MWNQSREDQVSYINSAAFMTTESCYFKSFIYIITCTVFIDQYAVLTFLKYYSPFILKHFCLPVSDRYHFCLPVSVSTPFFLFVHFRSMWLRELLNCCWSISQTKRFTQRSVTTRAHQSTGIKFMTYNIVQMKICFSTQSGILLEFLIEVTCVEFW